MRHVDAEQGYSRSRVWKSFNIRCLRKVYDQSDEDALYCIKFEDAETADFELAANCHGS